MSAHKFEVGDLVVSQVAMSRWYRPGAVGRVLNVHSGYVEFIAGDYDTNCGGAWYSDLQKFRPGTIADLPRDEWHDAKTTCPDKVGAYEAEWRVGITKWAWWHGEFWGCGLGSSPADAENYATAIPPIRWRGIIQAAAK